MLALTITHIAGAPLLMHRSSVLRSRLRLFLEWLSFFFSFFFFEVGEMGFVSFHLYTVRNMSLVLVCLAL